jgi:hypothetical protein
MLRMVTLSAEAVAALILGALTFFDVVLPVIPLWWRLGFVVAFMLVVADLCLRSSFMRHHFPQPYQRVLLSAFLPLLIMLVLWNPMRFQYMNEHRPPGLPFIFGAPFGENDSPIWMMLVKHYGADPAYNCDISFWDADRKEILDDWIKRHPGAPYSEDLTAASQKNLHVAEIDAIGQNNNFTWNPVNPDRQHYTIAITCRNGEFEEDWQIARINDVLLTKIKVMRNIPPWAWPDRIVFECSDEKFYSAKPIFSRLLHRYVKFPVIILDPNKNLEVMTQTPETPDNCWKFLVGHFGDATLPLVLPANADDASMVIAVFIFAVLVYFPLYFMLAHWWVGSSNVIESVAPPRVNY